MLASGESFLPPHVRATCFDLVVGSQPLASRAFASQSILLFSVSTAPSHQSRESLPSISFFVSFLHLGHRPSNPGSVTWPFKFKNCLLGSTKAECSRTLQKVISKVIGWGTNIQTNAFTNTYAHTRRLLSHTHPSNYGKIKAHADNNTEFFSFFFFVRLSVCLLPTSPPTRP